ncbi:MAG: Endo-1,4-beta-xylanase A precursor [Candidatus Omnitrophica bacterium ADurb.Bin277]|mgnify:CR=1 FL=1|nr:MAG: Endo-1,4-beta-xylanase A precursor [Candidatus Omnitrophica bacterium ADurb.Bin277]
MFLRSLVLWILFPAWVFAAVPADDAFLDEVQERSFRYFLDEVNPYNGLVRDSASHREGIAGRAPASIAATGFALTAYPAGVERGWMDRGKARELTRRTLEFFLRQAPHQKGFFYHFLDFETGKRVKNSELSPIDTALFLAGAVFAGEYYGDPEIRDLARKIYERVDFPWMMNKGESLALSWTPESGFSRLRWDHFDESLLLYVLAIGAPDGGHPLPPAVWGKLQRPAGSYRDYRLIQMPPLFTHQYPQIWLDLKNKNDGQADYFKNSVNATLANKAFCEDQASKYRTYREGFWGLSASDGPSGYKAYGAPPGWSVVHDGTVAPTACGSSIVFTPEESIACLRRFREKYGEKMWGRYGFADAMNVDKNWMSDKVIGIDQGALLLMIENYRTGFVWRHMMKNEFVRNALQKIGFREGSVELPWPEPPVYRAPYVPDRINVDAMLRDWPAGGAIHLTSEGHAEFGQISGSKDLSAKIRFAWDETFLYFIAQVNDDHVQIRRTGRNIWRDDLVELYIDPDGDGFYWDSPSDYQIGFRPSSDAHNEMEVWSWFQGGESFLESGKALAASYTDAQGYIVEGAIRWEALGVRPRPSLSISISPAVHDVDPREGDAKLVWFFRNEREFQRFVLGRVILEEAKGGA